MRGRFRYVARQPLDTFRQIRFSGSRAQACPFPVKDQRKQFFFWLGVVVLPLFWSWFTLAKTFSRRDRLIAFLWMAAFVVWLLVQRSAVAEQVCLASIMYPVVLGWISVALGVWLMIRLRVLPATLFEYIIFFDVIGVLSPIMLFADRIGGDFEWPWLLQPLALALAHLAVEPIGRLRFGRAQV